MKVRILPLLPALALLAPGLSHAAAMKAGVNVPCLEKIVKSDAPTPEAWITLGYLDQVRGDLKEASEKYKKAFGAGAKDLANAPLDFTLVGDVIWIQDDACKVPVPPAGADASTAADVKSLPNPKYPDAVQSIASEGNATAVVVVGPDRKPMRISVKEASAGPPQIHREAYDTKPGENDAARLLSRVQFALVTIQTLRDTKFPDGNSGKVVTQKFLFQPPKDILEKGGLPGKTDSSMMDHADPSGASLPKPR